MVQEEGDLLGRGELGRHDEVALVLAVLVVDDDHDLAPPTAAIASSILAKVSGPVSGPAPRPEQALHVLDGHVDLEVHPVAGPLARGW